MNSKIIQIKNTKPQARGLTLIPEEKKQLIDFFSLLIEIDRRTNITGVYEKSTN